MIKKIKITTNKTTVNLFLTVTFETRIKERTSLDYGSFQYMLVQFPIELKLNRDLYQLRFRFHPTNLPFPLHSDLHVDFLRLRLRLLFHFQLIHYSLPY